MRTSTSTDTYTCSRDQIKSVLYIVRVRIRRDDRMHTGAMLACSQMYYAWYYFLDLTTHIVAIIEIGRQ